MTYKYQTDSKDLGVDVTLEGWRTNHIRAQGTIPSQRSGVILKHHHQDDPTHVCRGFIVWDDPEWETKEVQWTLLSLDPLSIREPIYFPCGFTGLVRDDRFLANYRPQDT